MSELADVEVGAERGHQRLIGLPFAKRAPSAIREAPSKAISVDIDRAVRVVLRNRLLVLGVLLATLVGALTITLAARREYRATATLQINSQPAQIIGSRNQPIQRFRNDDQYLQTQFGILNSRALAERVVRDLKLADDPSFTPSTVPANRRAQAATFKVMGNLEVVPLRGSDLVLLAYTDPIPARAAQVANGFATGFIAATTENRYNTTNYARNFLQNQLAAARQKLENSERALVLYAQGQGIVELERGAGRGGGNGDGPSSVTGDSLSSQTLVSLNNALAAATSDRIAAEQAYRQASEKGVSGEQVADPALQSLRAERARLEADYREKLGTFKPDYPDMMALQARIVEVRSAIARETGVINSSLASHFRSVAGRENELRAKVSSLRAEVLNLRNRGIEYNFLQREVDTNRELYDALLQRYKEIGVVGELGESQATVIDTALPPVSAYRPQPLRNLGIGLVLGLLLGLGLAFAKEFIDDTVKSPEDLAEMLDVPALGVVPHLPRGDSLSLALEDSKSPVTEGYQSIMAALRFVGDGGMPRSLLITSSRANEGKSSTSLALARNLAQIGKRVLLIDADMRNPSFLSDGAKSDGLSTLLSGSAALLEGVVSTKTANMSLLPSGPIPPAPAQLLATVRIHELIAEAEQNFDFVIVDAPPVLGLADAPILGSICEATLLVVEASSARRNAVAGTLRRLLAANARVVGTVLTKFRLKSGMDNEHYGYGYAYSYGDGGQRSGGLRATLSKHARGDSRTLDVRA